MRHPRRPSHRRSASVEYTHVLRRGFAVVAVTSLVMFAACGGSASDKSALTTDSALGRDLALAASDTGVKPKLQDGACGQASAQVAVQVDAETDQRAASPCCGSSSRAGTRRAGQTHHGYAGCWDDAAIRSELEGLQQHHTGG
jgi:hypothetical protein